MTTVLEMTGVSRRFDTPGAPLEILKSVNLTMATGDAIALRGPSGCGKSTLLYLAGTLDQPSSGTIRILNEDPWKMSPDRLAGFRNQHLGFVFQDHQLLPQCSVLENVLLPTLAGFGGDTQALGDRARHLLEQVGLQDRSEHLPGALSGGERQRAAVCRALIYEPELLLADEPTGNLDPHTANIIGELLLRMADDHGTGLLCVTHSDSLAKQFPHQVHMSAGEVNYATDTPSMSS